MCFNPSPVRRVPSPNRYISVAKFCFCKNNKRLIDCLNWRRSKSGGGPGSLHRHRDPQRLSIAMQIHGSLQKKSRLGGDVNHRSPKGLARRPRLQSSTCRRGRLLKRPRPAKKFCQSCSRCKLFRRCTPCTPFRRAGALRRVIEMRERHRGRRGNVSLSGVHTYSRRWLLPSRRWLWAAVATRFRASWSRPPAKPPVFWRACLNAWAVARPAGVLLQPCVLESGVSAVVALQTLYRKKVLNLTVSV